MRSVLALLTVALAAVVATSCGGGGISDGAAVAQAADKTQAAKTARVSMMISAGGQQISGSGLVDLQRRRTSLTMRLPRGTMREVAEGTELYLQIPGASSKLPSGKHWMKLDLGRIARARGIDLDSLDGGASDLSGSLDQLRGAGSVTKVGSERVRGVQTTHYKAVVNLDKAASRAPAARRAAARQSVKRVEAQLGRSTLPVEAWIDQQGRLRRERFNIPIKGHQVSMSADFFDFGVRPVINAPPAGDTYDITNRALKQR